MQNHRKMGQGLICERIWWSHVPRFDKDTITTETTLLHETFCFPSLKSFRIVSFMGEMIFDFSSDKISRFLPSSFRFKNQYSWWHPVRIAHMEILSYNGYPSGALSSSAWFSALPSLSMRLLEFQKSFRQFWIFSLPRYETHDICSMHLFDKGEFVALMIKFLEKM